MNDNGTLLIETVEDGDDDFIWNFRMNEKPNKRFEVCIFDGDFGQCDACEAAKHSDNPYRLMCEEHARMPLTLPDFPSPIGKVRLVADADPFFGGPLSEPYKSKILENPTLLSMIIEVEWQMRHTLDFHHIFLTGFCPLKEQPEEGVLHLRASMGS